MYYSKCNMGYVIRIEFGEEIQEALRQFAYKVNLQGGFFQGVGTLTQVELAFFCSETKGYDRHFFDEDYELISLMGNLSAHDGVMAPHTHVTLGNRMFQTISGHLVRGIVSVTAEILVMAVDLALTRKEDPILGYKGLVLPNWEQMRVEV